MNYYKTIIQYEGTLYAGFQWQNALTTVQSEINDALSKILEDKVTTMAASRTDTGVHAIHQVVKISSVAPINLSTFIEEFNAKLPSSIRCLDITNCHGLFRPSVESQSKEYRYFFTNKTQVKKEDMQFMANIANPLDIESINTCIEALKGTHDFCNFYSSGSNVKSTIRTITQCELTLINPHAIFDSLSLFSIPQDLTECFQLKVEANGFLKQMIRHLVSALWMVGSKKISTQEFLDLLHGPKIAKQKWKVAPANGLYLYKIIYP